MDFLIVNHHGSGPDEPATRSYDIGRNLVALGHRVTIIASSFSFYSKHETRLKSGEWWTEEILDGVRFVWVRSLPYQKNDWRRVINMFSFCANAIRAGILLCSRQDVVMGVNPPPMAVFAGWVISIYFRAHFWFEVKDLWPQTLISMGAIKSKSILAHLMRFFEKFLFKRAERIIVLLPFAHEYINSLGISPNKVIWIPNGIDFERIQGLNPYDGGLPDHLTIMYLGGHTASNSLDTVLQTAKTLQDKGMDGIRFVFVGDGTEKPNLINLARELELVNVEFRDEIPKGDVYRTMNEADVFVMSLKNVPDLHRYGISLNKMYDYLVSGRPIVLAGSPSNNPVKETGAGINIPPEDPEAMAEAFLRILNMSAPKRRLMGSKGFTYVKEHHDIRVLANKFESLF